MYENYSGPKLAEYQAEICSPVCYNKLIFQQNYFMFAPCINDN